MLAKQELCKYKGGERVWAGKYKNSHNVLHWHYACELLYVEHGKIDVFCGEQTYRLTDGQAFFIDGGEMHYMHARADTVLEVLMFDGDVIKKISERTKLASPLLKSGYDIPKTFAAVAAELKAKRPYYAVAAENEVLSLMLEIFRNEPTKERKKSGDTVQAFKDLLSDVSEHYAYYTFSDAAKYMNFSEAYFSKYFKKTAGMTFSQYLNRVKTEEAIRLLRDGQGLAVTEIAMRCGFNTIRNFNRIFKEVTGYTPKTLPEDFALRDLVLYPVSDSFNPTSPATRLLTEK